MAVCVLAVRASAALFVVTFCDRNIRVPVPQGWSIWAKMISKYNLAGDDEQQLA